MSEEVEEEILPAVPFAIEQKLTAILKKKAKKNCGKELAAYSDCTKTKAISIFYLCRDQLKEMNDCFQKYINDDEKAKLKRKWQLLKKQKEGEEKSQPSTA
eukprot:TRINITY_DN14759_c0_g1_i1.p1 TRINITY_DN14759_c0_g1~~TRINITY_DN14759_c0_g1_i1.p1  ORF type:complete len:101 (+),score=28.97 TRINITY_DN14759_c0_g1_i1:26-328(+)